MQKNFSIRVSDDISRLFAAPEPTVALNLMSLSTIISNAINAEKAVFWVDGVMGSFACYLNFIRVRRIPGRDLLAGCISYVAKNFKERPVVVLADGKCVPNFAKLLGRDVQLMKAPWITSADEIECFPTISITSHTIVFIGVASPKQEWLAQAIYKKTGAKCFCVGGAINMIERRERAAPALIMKMGLEWLFRLTHEPRRRIARLLGSAIGGVHALIYLRNLTRL